MTELLPIAPQTASNAAIQTVAEQAGNLSVALAEASGHLDGIDNTLGKNAIAVHSIRDLISNMSIQNQDVTRFAYAALTATNAARQTIDQGRSRMQNASTHMHEFARDVGSLGDGIINLRESLSEVSRVASEISDIARTTNLLAINAAIEAARAGPEGKGFMVVAQEIKLLANRTEVAINLISERLAGLDGQNAELGMRTMAALDGSQALQTDAAAMSQVMDEISSATAQVDEQQSKIVQASQVVDSSVAKIDGDIASLTHGIDSAAQGLRATRGQVSSLVGAGEAIVGASAELDVRTIDSPYIDAVIAAAAQISSAFEAAISRGEASLAQFFDTRLQPVLGSNPPQMMAPFTALTDKILPPIQEPLLAHFALAVFCAALDKRGYLPTHNMKFSHPQRPHDPDWNAANCRNRRIFDDRVGLAAGQNTRKFLLQAYRRDMGNSNFVMMKDVSAPITILGRHWGGLRLAYKVS